MEQLMELMCLTLILIAFVLMIQNLHNPNHHHRPSRKYIPMLITIYMFYHKFHELFASNLAQHVISLNSRPMKDLEKSKAMGADPTTYQYVVQETKKNSHLLITVKPSKVK